MCRSFFLWGGGGGRLYIYLPPPPAVGVPQCHCWSSQETDTGATDSSSFGNTRRDYRDNLCVMQSGTLIRFMPYSDQSRRNKECFNENRAMFCLPKEIAQESRLPFFSKVFQL